MICIEGLDNSGKSTLVEKLCKDFPQLQRVPSIGNKHPSAEEITRQAWEVLDNDRRSPLQVVDRLRFFSEYIYNPKYTKRPLSFGGDDWFMMWTQYFRRPQLFIYCKRPLARVLESFDEREQFEGLKDKMSEIEALYEKLTGFVEFCFEKFEHVGHKFIRYDYELTNYDFIHALVSQYVNQYGEVPA